MIGIDQLPFTCRIAILWIWLAGVVVVAKGTFSVLVMVRGMQGS